MELSSETLLINILELELSKFFNKLKNIKEIEHSYINSIIDEYKIKIIDDDSRSQINTNKCMARTFKNGLEQQCSLKHCKGTLCKKHSNKLIYGLITDELDIKFKHKFTKLFNRNKINNDRIISLNLKNNSLLNCKDQLITIYIENTEYLMNEIDQLIYTNDIVKPCYIGKLVDGFIVRI